MTTKTSFFVIINPISGNGKSTAVWKKIKDKLNQLYTLEFEFSNYPSHEIELTKSALKKGFKHFIIIGGDGTLNNFINGVFNQNITDTKAISFGVIPVGTGNDWIKTHNIPKQTNRALDVIIKGHKKTQDIGCICFLNTSKKNKYFINLAGVGFDGLVVNKVKDNRRLGQFTYILGALKSLSYFKLFDTNVTINNHKKTYKNCFIIQLGICKFTGSGMRLTENPDPKDGLLDITIATNFTKWTIFKNIVNLFNGKITHAKNVETFKTDHLKLSFTTDQPFIQADGELIDTNDIEVTVIQNAVNFYG